MKKVTNQVITFRIPFKKKVKNFKLDSKKYILRNIKKSFLVEVKVPHFLEEGYRNIEISNRIIKLYLVRPDRNVNKEMIKITNEK